MLNFKLAMSHHGWVGGNLPVAIAGPRKLCIFCIFRNLIFRLMFYRILAVAVADDISTSDETGRKARNDPQRITRF